MMTAAESGSQTEPLSHSRDELVKLPAWVGQEVPPPMRREVVETRDLSVVGRMFRRNPSLTTDRMPPVLAPVTVPELSQPTNRQIRAIVADVVQEELARRRRRAWTHLGLVVVLIVVAGATGAALVALVEQFDLLETMLESVSVE